MTANHHRRTGRTNRHRHCPGTITKHRAAPWANTTRSQPDTRIAETKYGGIDAGDDARLRRQMALLAGLVPSVAAIQESKDWDRGNFRTFHLAERLLGMRGFLSPSAHHGCHLAVFVREGAGLRVTEQRHEYGDPWWHGVACVLVEADGFPRPLQLASCHLAPRPAH